MESRSSFLNVPLPSPDAISQREDVARIRRAIEEIDAALATNATRVGALEQTVSGLDVYDTEPDPAAFPAIVDVALNSSVVSAPLTITGITGVVAVSVGDGEWRKSQDCGASWGNWTAGAGSIAVNDQVQVRHTSSAADATTVTTTLMIGSLALPFASTTLDIYALRPMWIAPTPAGGAINVSLEPAFGTNAFGVNSGYDTHRATDWELWTGPGGTGSCVWHSTFDTINKTSVPLPAGTLATFTTYYARVRHHGTVYGASAWSVDRSFTTGAGVTYGWDNYAGVGDGPPLTAAAYAYTGSTYPIVVTPSSAVLFYAKHESGGSTGVFARTASLSGIALSWLGSETDLTGGQGTMIMPVLLDNSDPAAVRILVVYRNTNPSADLCARILSVHTGTGVITVGSVQTLGPAATYEGAYGGGAGVASLCAVNPTKALLTLAGAKVLGLTINGNTVSVANLLDLSSFGSYLADIHKIAVGKAVVCVSTYSGTGMIHVKPLDFTGGTVTLLGAGATFPAGKNARRMGQFDPANYIVFHMGDSGVFQQTHVAVGGAGEVVIGPANANAPSDVNYNVFPITIDGDRVLTCAGTGGRVTLWKRSGSTITVPVNYADAGFVVAQATIRNGVIDAERILTGHSSNGWLAEMKIRKS